jgi:hypothetical protein
VKEIIFSSPISDLIEKPTPSLIKIPKSYKNMTTHLNENVYGEPTVKRCIPFLDALTIGYTINTPIEYLFDVSKKMVDNQETDHFQLFYAENVPECLKEFIGLGSHDLKQVSKELRSNHRTLDMIAKLINPWTIKTPPGYSCIFTTPFNRNLPFKIIDGVVDTDQYNLPIHFPFYWTQDISIKQTILPPGTPMALVIPFKRDDWKMKIEKNNYEEFTNNSMRLSQYIIDKYKKLFWKKKSFK